jgi:hypothetical protein
VRDDGRAGLLAVPRAVDAEPLGQVLEPHHRVGQEQVAERVRRRDDLVPVTLGEKAPEPLARGGRDGSVGVDRDPVPAEPAGQRLVVGHRHGPGGLDRAPRRERHEGGIAGAEGDQGGHPERLRGRRGGGAGRGGAYPVAYFVTFFCAASSFLSDARMCDCFWVESSCVRIWAFTWSNVCCVPAFTTSAVGRIRK